MDGFIEGKENVIETRQEFVEENPYIYLSLHKFSSQTQPKTTIRQLEFQIRQQKGFDQTFGQAIQFGKFTTTI